MQASVFARMSLSLFQESAARMLFTAASFRSKLCMLSVLHTDCWLTELCEA